MMTEEFLGFAFHALFFLRLHRSREARVDVEDRMNILGFRLSRDLQATVG